MNPYIEFMLKTDEGKERMHTAFQEHKKTGTSFDKRIFKKHTILHELKSAIIFKNVSNLD